MAGPVKKIQKLYNNCAKKFDKYVFTINRYERELYWKKRVTYFQKNIIITISANKAWKLRFPILRLVGLLAVESLNLGK